MAHSCLCEQCCLLAAPTYTEQYRHECEVRALNAMTRWERLAYINGTEREKGVRQQRGDAAADRLLGDVKR